ncbi:MAG: HDOD domain-containing protein [Mariprofundus sp.]|nr:HDOD domain-containing protein [Mariprofundus sp.]
MSWLNKLIHTSSTDTANTTAPTPNVEAHKPATQATNKQPASDESDKRTLQMLLQECRVAPSTPPDYDLLKPHPMKKEAQDRLNQRIESIPPMPEIWNEIQAILAREGSSASDLGQCVARDPVLTARVLAVCNSAAYASPGQSEITNIPLAIARLGLQEATALLFQTLIPNMGSPESHTQVRHVLFHSQAIAALSRLLAEPTLIVDRSQASLNGMLHDIGKLVVFHIEKSPKLTELATAIRSGSDSLSAEYAILGYTHIDAGMMLALHWRLPKHVRQFIEHHHHANQLDELATPAPDNAMVDHLAHLILQQLLAGKNMQQGAVWQQHQRHLRVKSTQAAINRLKLPITSTTYFQQLEKAIERLKINFPDLFPSQL